MGPVSRNGSLGFPGGENKGGKGRCWSPYLTVLSVVAWKYEATKYFAPLKNAHAILDAVIHFRLEPICFNKLWHNCFPLFVNSVADINGDMEWSVDEVDAVLQLEVSFSI